MTLLLRFANKIFNHPHLITPDKAQVLLDIISPRAGVDQFQSSQFEGEHVPERDDDGNLIRPTKYSSFRLSGSTAIITIDGTLVTRGAWLNADSGLVSYEGIQKQLNDAEASNQVKSIILDLHTPGGDSIGAMETADLVRSINVKKPVVAVVNGMAASAGYAIASGAGEIVTTRTGMSGSIGVVLFHADLSKKMESEGVKPTFIYAGAHKVDGNPFEPLEDDVHADFQKLVDEHYQHFLETVAAGRGERLTVDMARATEARMFVGADAVEAGLADRVGTFEQVLAELNDRAGGAKSLNNRRISMSGNETSASAETGITTAEHEVAIAAATQEGMKLGAEQERSRLTAILSTDGIKGNGVRMSAAIELAADAPEMTSEKVAEHAMKAAADETTTGEQPGANLENRHTLPTSLGTAASEQPGQKQKSGLTALVDRAVSK